MADDFELVEAVEVGTNNMQVYQQDKATIDMQIATARRWPRNLKKVVDTCVAIISLDAEFADDCTYTLKKGNKLIAGPSVYLARLVAQQMGNIRVENRVVGYSDTHVTVEATCFDLENNFAMRTQIKKSIIGSSGKYSEDMQVTTGNAANAVALRNAIFAVVPQAVTKKVYDAAKKSIAGDLSDAAKLLARRVKLFDGLIGTYGITEMEILKSVGKASVDHITPDDIVAIIGFDKAIKEGEQKVDEIFRPDKMFVAHRNKQPEIERLELLIGQAKKLSDLTKIQSFIVSYPTMSDIFDKKYQELKQNEMANKPTSENPNETK
jgi:hypothetical protein